jgi:hypothetical protein
MYISNGCLLSLIIYLHCTQAWHTPTRRSFADGTKDWPAECSSTRQAVKGKLKGRTEGEIRQNSALNPQVAASAGLVRSALGGGVWVMFGSSEVCLAAARSGAASCTVQVSSSKLRGVNRHCLEREWFWTSSGGTSLFELLKRVWDE